MELDQTNLLSREGLFVGFEFGKVGVCIIPCCCAQIMFDRVCTCVENVGNCMFVYD